MDRLGPRRASAGSLGLAAVCYLACALPGPGLLAVFLFNMTMPVTLWAAARTLPGAKGFTFGLLTFALFLGFLPSFLGCLHASAPLGSLTWLGSCHSTSSLKAPSIPCIDLLLEIFSLLKSGYLM